MALNKRQYTDGQTIITAANLNEIQDCIITLENNYVPKTRTVAGKALSSNITLAASDVGAVPTSRTINSKALTGNITLSAADVGAVPVARTVNGKALSSNITLNAADVSAVPTTRTVNSKALSADISLTASDVGAVPTSRTVNGKALSSNITLASSDIGDDSGAGGTTVKASLVALNGALTKYNIHTYSDVSQIGLSNTELNVASPTSVIINALDSLPGTNGASIIFQASSSSSAEEWEAKMLAEIGTTKTCFVEISKHNNYRVFGNAVTYQTSGDGDYFVLVPEGNKVGRWQQIALQDALDVGITLRTAVASAANFNEIKQAGVYFVTYRTNYVNAPATWGTLVVYQPSSNSSTVVQEFNQHSRKWMRYYTDNTWYAWREVMLDVTPITSITTASNIITLNEGFTWVEGRAMVWGKVCQIYIDIKSDTNIASGTTTIGTLPSAFAPATSTPLTKLYAVPSGITGGRIQASDRTVKIYGSVSANIEVGIAGTFLLA